MFNSIPTDETPLCIPFVTNQLNQYCNSQITIMINNISNDYKIDFSELQNLTKKTVKFKLSKNVHYPPTKSSRCMARIWNDGKGAQCKRKKTHGKFCNIHHKQFMNCKSHNCSRGINGLGACDDKKHKGLWLGTIDKPLPRKNSKGTTIIKWLGDKTIKIKKKKIKKKVKIKFNKNLTNALDTSNNFKKIKEQLSVLLETLDLDDPTNTNSVIMKRLSIILKKNIDEFKNEIYETINEFWDEQIAKELSDSDETDSSCYDISSKLTQYYEGDKTFYVHTQTNEIYDNPKTLNIIGIMTSKGKFELF